MITKTTDLDVLKGKKIYVYGTEEVARRLFFILWERYPWAVAGFVLCGNERAKNNSVYGIPVVDIGSIPRTDNTYVVVAVQYWDKKYAVDELLSAGLYHLLMLHDKFVKMLCSSLEDEQIEYFDGTDYTIYAADEVETYHAVLVNRFQPWAFKARIPSDEYWFEELKDYMGKRYLHNNRIQKYFESEWGPFYLVEHLPETAESDAYVACACDCYSVRCHVDKPLTTGTEEKYLTEIQAGAALTDKRICDVLDNSGDNISDRNRDFSECSAIYWLWKNAEKKDYIGVCHYRRHLAVTTADLAAEFEKGTDVINTIPTIMLPSIKEFFKKNFFYDRDIDLIEEAIDKMFPEYRQAYEEMGDGFIYLANNIFIMKTEWFDRMCVFVFGIILYVDDFYRQQGFVRQDRYAGYIFEYLYAVFIRHHAKELKITYADMKFLE